MEVTCIVAEPVLLFLWSLKSSDEYDKCHKGRTFCLADDGIPSTVFTIE